MIKLEEMRDIHSLVESSIGGDLNQWWYNLSAGSDIGKLRQEGKLSRETLARFRQAVAESLAWLKEDGLAKEIRVTAEIDNQRINYRVVVERPEGNIAVEGVWNGI